MSAIDPEAASFEVTATAIDALAPPSRARISGRLDIARSEVVFRPRDGGVAIRHVSPAVAVTVARLRAPWANVALLIQGSDRCVRVRLPWTALARLRRALHAAGVAGEIHRSWRAQPGPRRPAQGRS